MRWLIVVLIAAGVVWPGEVSAQGGCPQAPGHREYAAFSGPWAKHGVSLDVSVDGCGILTYRTYRWCPTGATGPGCDWFVGHRIEPGGGLMFRLDTHHGQAASGRIVIARPTTTGDGIILRLREDGHLGVEWDGEESVLCRPWAWETEWCGA